MATRNDQRTRDARARILDAATRSIAENGIRDTSFRLIADATDMSTGSIAYHFGSKAGLLEAVLDSAVVGWASPLFESHDPSAESIDRFIQNHLRVTQHLNGGALTLLLEEALTTESVFTEIIRSFYAQIGESLSSAFPSGDPTEGSVSNDAMISVVLGALVGMHLQWRLDKETDIRSGHRAAQRLFNLPTQRIAEGFAAKLSFEATDARATWEERTFDSGPAEAGRNRLLVAAALLFAESGYANTSFEDIEQRASVSRGSISWHFGSKSGLLLAVVDELVMGQEGWGYWRKHSGSGRIESFGAMLEQAYERVRSPTGRLLAVLQRESLHPQSPIRNEYWRRYSEFRSILAEWWSNLGDGLDIAPADFGFVSLGAISGVHLLWRLEATDAPLAEQLQALYGVVAAAASAPSDP